MSEMSKVESDSGCNASIWAKVVARQQSIQKVILCVTSTSINCHLKYNFI